MNLIFLDIKNPINYDYEYLNDIFESIQNTKIVVKNLDFLFFDKKFGDKIFGYVKDNETIEDWLTNKKDRLKIGYFCILTEDFNKELYSRKIPNNVVYFSESEGLSEKRIKEVAWVLSGFGKDKPMTNNIWFTSDTHFFHENIIKYCDRPFSSVDEMNEVLIKNWNTKVGKDDIVWHLGDFSFGKKENIEIVKKLNGRINIVLGNHDHQKIKFYYEAGFNRVYDRPVIINNFFILSHAPLEWVQNPMYNIFGHVHTTDLYKTWAKCGCCVCTERHNYSPISWKEIQEKIKSLENN